MTGERQPATIRQVGAGDVRGRPVTLLDSYALKLSRRHDVIPAEPLRKIAEEVVGCGLQKGSLGLLYAVPAGMGFVSVVVIIRFFDCALSGNLAEFLDVGTLLLLSGFFWAWCLWTLLRQVRPRAFAGSC